jgi:hypothetical protein
VSAIVDHPIQPSMPTVTPSFFSSRQPPSRRPPISDRLVTGISTILRERFCHEHYAAIVEEFAHDLQPFASAHGGTKRRPRNRQ